MIDMAAEHIGFVVASYGLSAAVVAGLCIWIIGRDRRLSRKLDGK
jgi:heme exporter protein CcmD